ncbi:tRNA lysidine(34) synthetase TilS, partial [Sediminivirga luteola]|uniref:tRNA lysidine(34) synthetase TilS n=1 Tax=Sediminivirga luteola TaxID=1774748 RepID=UPI001F5899BB
GPAGDGRPAEPGAEDPWRVVIGVSGGADSMALAAATAFLQRALPLRAQAVLVDHGLQSGARRAAESAAEQLRTLGLETLVVPAAVDREHPAGLEAAARRARYAALEAARRRYGAAAIMLGHTLDDQAETVLLGLARGSGARSLAGMAPARGMLLRPLLGLRRAQLRASCHAQGLRVWDDPMNADDAYARVRARRHALPALEQQLGPGITEALARTAAQLRADADHLEAEAAQAAERLLGDSLDRRLDRAPLAAVPEALRTRVLRRWLVDLIGTGQDLSYEHVRAVDALVTGARRGAVSLPGDVIAVAEGTSLRLRDSGPGQDGPQNL